MHVAGQKIIQLVKGMAMDQKMLGCLMADIVGQGIGGGPQIRGHEISRFRLYFDWLYCTGRKMNLQAKNIAD
jgi:hypothetical protein